MNLSLGGRRNRDTWKSLSDRAFLYEYYKDYMRHRDTPELMADPKKKTKIDTSVPTVTTVNVSARYDLTRKISVLSNSFYMQNDPTAPMKEVELYSTQVEDNVLGLLDYSYVIRCNNTASLRQWLIDADALIKSSRLIFLTELKEICKGDDYYNSTNVLSVDPQKMKFKVTETIPGWIDMKEYLPLFQLELPYIEGMDLKTLNKVMDDYPEELGAFRGYLSRALTILPSAMGSEQSSEAIRKIQTEVDEGVRITDIEYRKIRAVSTMRLGAAATATWSFFLYAFFFEAPDLIRILGPSGAITLVAKEVAGYLQRKYDFKKNSFAFLALVRRSQRG